MSQTALLRRGFACGLFASLALHASVGFAQAREISIEKLEALTRAYAELRRQNPLLEDRSAEQIAADAQEIARIARERTPDSSTVTGHATQGSVTVAARCAEGYVVNGTQRASASDVRIVAAERGECDGGRCRSYQVTAARDSAQPFDLEVSVTCS